MRTGADEAMHTLEPNLVSVVMPAHNSQFVLAESVRSVLTQTYTEWELLIVDDASTDATNVLAREFAETDQRIRLITLAENGGVARARNTGIQAARGRYLAFLDSDDLWLPEKLRTQIEFMQRTGAAFSFTRYRRFGADKALTKPLKVPSTVQYQQLLKGNVIGCLTVIIDRAKIPEVSMPETKHEDYVTWLGILRRGQLAWGLQRDLARYRVANSSISANKKNSAGWTWNIYRRIEGLTLLRSAWCFAHYVGRSMYVRIVY